MSKIKNNKISEDLIIENAIDLIKNKGLSEFTIRDLAKKSNVSVGTLYNYFSDKESLIFFIMKNFWEQTINIEMEKILNKKISFIEMLEKIYSLLNKKSSEFHRDFIKDLSFKTSYKNSEKNGMSTYLKIITEKILKMISFFPDLEEKIKESSSLEEFSIFITDNLFILLTKNSKDLGVLKIILENFYK